MQNASFKAFDFLGRLVPLEVEERLARFDKVSVGLEPADEVPSSMFQPSRGMVISLAMIDFTYSATRSRMAWAIVSGLGTTAASSGGL